MPGDLGGLQWSCEIDLLAEYDTAIITDVDANEVQNVAFKLRRKLGQGDRETTATIPHADMWQGFLGLCLSVFEGLEMGNISYLGK